MNPFPVIIIFLKCELYIMTIEPMTTVIVVSEADSNVKHRSYLEYFVLF
jgi:hypothetical protein